MTDKALHNFEQKQFNKSLIKWFLQNKRDLPWRRTKDPYSIWVSEVMLQQTKVDTVISYYEKFLAQYPTPFELAQANEEEVLKVWEGLGYYRRAKNLHAAVKEVVASYDGKVPDDVKQLAELKGIGPYTKGAIMSIAFNRPEPAVDGNVMRVLSRVLLIEENVLESKVRKRFENIVRTMISQEDPSSFNQGLMELGALICIPRNPLCNECPVQDYCRAYQKSVQSSLPVRINRNKQKEKEYIVLCLFNDHGEILIEKRESEGLLAGMWQFPMIPKGKVKTKTVVEWMKENYALDVSIDEKIGHVKHVFSHLIWQLTAYVGRVTTPDQNKSTFVNLEELNNFPMSIANKKVEKLLK